MIWKATTVVLAVALAVAAFTAVRRARQAPAPPPPPVRASIDAPSDAELGAGDDVLDAALSPDGRELVFVATSEGISQLWRRALDSDRAEALNGTEGASMPAWKRTGNVVSFFAGRALRQIPIRGGSVQHLAEASSPAGASWLPDGSLLFAPGTTGTIKRLRAGVVSDVTTLRAGDLAHVAPEAVGSSGDFLYVAVLAGGRRMVRLVRSNGEIDLARTSGHAALVGNILVHVLDGALSAQRFDAETGALTGRAARLAFDVGLSGTGRAFFAASPRVLAWAAASPRARGLAWFDLQGHRVGSVSEPGDYWQVRLSPGDDVAAVTMLDPLLRTLDVFAVPALDTPAPSRRITLSLSADSDPVWAPDGSRIAFRSMQGGQPNVFARPPQFSERSDEELLRSELDETPTDWRGGTLLFHAPGSGTGYDVWALDVASRGRRAVAHGGFNESDARWSPDGRWMAYVSDEPGRPEIFVERWPQDGHKWRVTLAGGTRPRWRRDGTGLFFLRDGALMQTRLSEHGNAPSFSAAIRLVDLPGVRDYAPATRSDRVLAIVPVARAASARAHVIVDWMSALERVP
jgi:Tol biopolymer transport system component